MDATMDRTNVTADTTYQQSIPMFTNRGHPLQMGLHDSELFYIDDLLEGRNMNAVIWTLFRLAILVNKKHSMSWSSYDLHAIDSRVLSTPPPPPCISDNKQITHHHYHADQPKSLGIRNSIKMNQYKESNANDTSLPLSTQQERGQDSQGINYYHHNPQQHPHYSLSSLPDEEDGHDYCFDLASTSFVAYQTSGSIKTVSSDSGYGTTRQSSWNQRKSRHTDHHPIPIQLASLFDGGPVSQDPSLNINHDLTLPLSTNTATTASNDSRLSDLSLSRTPFQPRHDEWTETCLNNARTTNDSTSNSKPSVIDMFSVPDQLQSSASSPLLCKSRSKQQHHHSTISPVEHALQKLAMAPPVSSSPLPPMPEQQAPNSIHGPPYNEPMSRRKSTGNLTPQKNGSITRTSSEIVYENNLELIDIDGQVTGTYKLGNVVGKGQFGIVYRALELRTGKMVAVKRIKVLSSKKRDTLDVMQEAQLLQRLSHPNIVKYEGFIQANGHVNIILEFVENGSLLSTLKSFGSFPETLAAGYCTSILLGLQYLHDQNVVHCDLKAANLLTTTSGHVKLSDFGVSLNLGLKETEVGIVAGTPNWMAPEVIELKGASTKSDIWSLGCTIIELCTGKPPYSDLLPMTALFRIVEDDYPPIPDGLSQTLCDFLRSCFAKNPDDRPTATELLTHSWICNQDQHEEKTSLTDTRSLTNASDKSSLLPSTLCVGLETAPNTPLDMEDTDNDFPPWLLPFSASKHHPRPSSVFAAKFQQQQQQKQQNHRYVKGTFPKGAVKCKSCQLPIKRNAFICEDCGFICHDQCKSETGCHRSTFISAATPPLPPSTATLLSTTHGQPSPTPTLSYNQESVETLVPENQQYQKKRRPTSSYSIQALLSTSSSSFSLLSASSPSAQQRYQQRRQSSIMVPPKPRASVSTQLRQHTRKLSRVFSSNKQQPSDDHHHHRHYLHHGYKSNDSLRLIKEEHSSLPHSKHPSQQSFSSSSSLQAAAPALSSPQKSNRRDKLKRRTTHPDDCIIS
ncbi:hypothetical protein [Absidia glauca]|uniref:Protein kinase domain-containing protein n=1 Tax=Absidia glauca TaxID=4829 RepID=A0A163JS75_ABSGL|nr:hypothetical protein [Absidia glauca]